MALVIALTGGIGSGKSSVANILAELGAAVIDTDEIAHDLTAAGQPGARAIAREFGAEYLDAGGRNAQFDAYSPVTGQYHVMTCTPGVPTVCRGGNNAVVYIR